MPTIAEILAKKSAARVERAAGDAGATEAIDRIDPKGKRMGALILNDTPPPKAPEPPKEPEERALSRTAGEEINITPTSATAAQTAWIKASVSLESDLCLVMDPDRELNPETVWLAVKHSPDRSLPPILIHRLPYPIQYPEPPPTADQPF